VIFNEAANLVHVVIPVGFSMANRLIQLAAQLEATKAELATAQQQEVEKRKEVAALDAEIEQKQRTLTSYSQTIDRITGAAA
jgi:peptidoglycan hydrolase CwlO-like protein